MRGLRGREGCEGGYNNGKPNTNVALHMMSIRDVSVGLVLL
jgi:hypothetical protein